MTYMPHDPTLYHLFKKDDFTEAYKKGFNDGQEALKKEIQEKYKKQEDIQNIYKFVLKASPMKCVTKIAEALYEKGFRIE